MLGVLNHPRLVHDWFTTTLLRWHGDGLVIYDRWVLNGAGFNAWGGRGGEVLLDVYYLCYLIAFIGVLFFLTRYRKQGWLKVKPHVTYDALLLAMIGVLVGAKTAYIFIYNPEFYFGDPPYGPVDTGDMLQRIFLNWSGMASHGAAFGVLAMALIWWLKARPKLPIAHIGDVGAISSAFGAIWIRLANFMNGELYGRAAPEGLPWAMRFPVRSGKGHQVFQHNGHLYERMAMPDDPEQHEAWLNGLREANPGGVIETGGNFVYYQSDGAYQQGYEVMRHTADGAEFLPPGELSQGLDFSFMQVVTTPRHPSQVYQLILEGLFVLIFLLWLRKRVKRAGMVVAGFWMAYPIARFVGEFFRQPDVQFQAQGNVAGTIIAGLSMGQILSLVMAGVGLAFFMYFRKKGRVIEKMEMYPPDKEEPQESDGDKKLSVPFEKDMGGSTGAGEIAGLSDIRDVLKRKEAEWEKEGQDEGIEPEEDTDDRDEDAEPEKPERGD